jgi:hypothetical protein
MSTKCIYTYSDDTEIPLRHSNIHYCRCKNPVPDPIRFQCQINFNIIFACERSSCRISFRKALARPTCPMYTSLRRSNETIMEVQANNEVRLARIKFHYQNVKLLWNERPGFSSQQGNARPTGRLAHSLFRLSPVPTAQVQNYGASPLCHSMRSWYGVLKEEKL